jgi:cell wall-associated NlpC family hydrolase
MYQKTLGAKIFLIAILLTGCSSSSDSKNEIASVIEATENYFVPDSRVDRFEAEVKSTSDSLVLSGETTLPGAKQALLDSLAAHNIAVVDSLELLPSQSLGAETYGLVNNSVANIRSSPSHPAQLSTQATLGMPLKVLKKEGGWYLIQTPDDYLGWVDSGGLERMSKEQYQEWSTAPKLIYQETYGFSHREPSASSEKVTDLVAGSILKLDNTLGAFYAVTYPDGRKAFVNKAEAKPYDQWQKDLSASKASLVESAKMMMGAPYLWGGTSTKGIDCSGFTKTIYFMNGRVIPRDASQQIKAGTLVDDQRNFDSLQVGDLLFFGKEATDTTDRRVVHVGMWIGDQQFIHSSGRVHISSVDSTTDNFDSYNLNRYLESRRYLDNWEGNIIQTATMYGQLNKE